MKTSRTERAEKRALAETLFRETPGATLAHVNETIRLRFGRGLDVRQLATIRSAVADNQAKGPRSRRADRNELQVAVQRVRRLMVAQGIETVTIHRFDPAVIVPAT